MKNLLVILFTAAGIAGTGFVAIAPEHPATTPPPTEIKLTPCEPSTAFPNAAITEFNYSVVGDSVTFKYTVKDYELGNQTPDAGSKICANSAKGQHIHLILNNAPYEAWYIPTFTKKLAEGHYVMLSFLSRSYHESIKTKKAYTIRQFNVGKDGGTKNNWVNLNQPLLFYSRPKGEYVGTETKKVLLDFYLVNVKLSKNGYHVRATINGKEFTINDWAPFYIEGLPMGECTIKLELLDKNDKPANTLPAYQTIERKIVLKDK